jgi:hypothetical protein
MDMIFRGHPNAGFFASVASAGDGSNPLKNLPGNQRTDAARYVCIVPLMDYQRMLVAEARRRNVWHYSDLEPAIIADIRAGRAALLIDLSNEGPRYNPSIFRELRAWLDANRLPPDRCIWLAQNRAIANTARADTNLSSAPAAFEYYDYYLKKTANAFSGRQILNDGERAANRFFSLDRKDKLLLCLNATPRVQRVLAVAALLHYQLLDQSLVSFSGMSYVKRGCSMAEVVQFVERYPKLHHLLPALSTVDQLSPLSVDNFQQRGNDLAFRIDQRPYERTFFSLVTETDFSEGQNDRVTEKVTKTFCMGHPAVVLGNPHSLKFMTSLGFQDWSHVIDPSSDTILAPGDRFEAVMSEVLRQAFRIRKDARGWLDGVREVGSFNINHAIGGRFRARCIEIMDRPVLNRLSALLGGV